VGKEKEKKKRKRKRGEATTPLSIHNSGYATGCFRD